MALAVVALAVVALAVVAFAAAVLVAAAFLAGATFGTLPAATISLKLAPARNAGTEVFFTLTASPVRGLRAVRAATDALLEDTEAGDGDLVALGHGVLDLGEHRVQRRGADFLSPRRAPRAPR